MSVLDPHVAAVRRFNRFYTKTIGVLGAHYYDSPFSVTEARVLYELAHRDGVTAAELGADLGLDAGYLSRILRRFAHDKLITRATSTADGRRSHLSLTKRGRAAFAAMNDRSSAEIRSMLSPATGAESARLVDAMGAIETILNRATTERAPVVLRPPTHGDLGWVVHRHGALYAAEYGLDVRFEALVARIVADFAEHGDPARDRCWIAEQNGAIVGSVFLMQKSKTVAKLRLLYVEPHARGQGIGHQLVKECVNTARALGYRKMTLWTQSSLDAARRIYQQMGFKRVSTERHAMFGAPQTAETWERSLSPDARRPTPDTTAKR